MDPASNASPAAESPPRAALTAQPAADPGGVLIGLDADVPDGLKAPGGYTLRSLAIILCIVMGVAVWMFGLRYLPLPNLWAYASTVVPIALVVWLTSSLVRSRRFKRLVGDPPKKVVFGSGKEIGREGRLLVVGKRALLAEFLGLGPARDETFEPIVIFAPRVAKMPKAGTAVLILTTVAVASLIEALRETTTLPLLRPGWITIMAGIAAGVGVQMLIWPTYLRIAPGRVDIMRFTIGRARPEVTVIDLKNAQVLAHFNRVAIFIRPRTLPPLTPPTGSPGPGEQAPPPVTSAGTLEAQWTTLNLRGVWNPAEVAHAVIRAAVSTAPTPPLPADQLLG